MRVLVAAPGPGFSVHDVYVGWCEGLLEAGARVARFNLDTRIDFYANAHLKRGRRWVKAFDDESAARLAVDGLMSLAYRFAPDVVVVVSAFFISHDLLDLLRARGSKVVVLHTEEPYELDRELEVAAHADVNIVNDPTHLARFEQLGPAWYQPHCYRPAAHHPAAGASSPEHVSDVVFAGTGYGSRIAFLEQVDWSGIDVALAGNWAYLDEGSPLRKFVAHDLHVCADNADVVELYQGSKVGLNLYRQEAQRPELSSGWAMGPREVEMAACGLFFLREPRGEGDELLPMLPTFGSAGQFGELARWYLARPARRAELSTAARAAVADRVFANAARRLLARLDA